MSVEARQSYLDLFFDGRVYRIQLKSDEDEIQEMGCPCGLENAFIESCRKQYRGGL